MHDGICGTIFIGPAGDAAAKPEAAPADAVTHVLLGRADVCDRQAADYRHLLAELDRLRLDRRARRTLAAVLTPDE